MQKDLLLKIIIFLSIHIHMFQVVTVNIYHWYEFTLTIFYQSTISYQTYTISLIISGHSDSSCIILRGKACKQPEISCTAEPSGLPDSHDHPSGDSCSQSLCRGGKFQTS